MKYIPSIAFEEMSGSAKGVTAAKTMGRKYIRNRGYGGGTRTAAQAAVKSVFKQLSQGWKSLTNEQILAWNSLALSQITGSNLYMRLNYWIVYCGGDALTVPPTLRGVEAPSGAAISLTADAFTFTLDSEPTENMADLKLVIMASAPQSNGVTRAKWFFVDTTTGEVSGEQMALAQLTAATEPDAGV